MWPDISPISRLLSLQTSWLIRGAEIRNDLGLSERSDGRDRRVGQFEEFGRGRRIEPSPAFQHDIRPALHAQNDHFGDMQGGFNHSRPSCQEGRPVKRAPSGSFKRDRRRGFLQGVRPEQGTFGYCMTCKSKTIREILQKIGSEL